MEELKAGQPASSIVQQATEVPTTTPSPIEGSIEELQEKLAAYQKFMSHYIVNAQEDKARAVKAAELAITQKYQDKMNAFMLEGTSEVASESDLFKGRKAKLAAAAKAGKPSRWGDAEVQKVAGTTVPASNIKTIKAQEPKIATDSSSSAASSSTPPEVIAADHGMRADGGVNGLTLAERVANGANGAVVSAVVDIQPSLYDKRNAKIASAVQAGKQSRWGSKEEGKAVQSAQSLPAAAPVNEIVASPEVTAADHGLRADGGVSGPSLAERVNLGAQILKE